MCCTRPPHVPVATIFQISPYMYIRNGLLIRLLKTVRQPTTGFALLGAHQVGAVPEFPSTACSTSTQIGLFFENYTHLQINLVFARDSPETQLNLSQSTEMHIFANKFGFGNDSLGTQIYILFVTFVMFADECILPSSCNLVSMCPEYSLSSSVLRRGWQKLPSSIVRSCTTSSPTTN
ncbi:hypothetical protein CSKR_108579 [Clonorchis sinensis]|uniref:Uncharacterized protein n=1 Tax=Clonorchis sinensis TaxID=79923 RepID=A0A3R7CM77_CLOSI|nr:hypothetical protein CSKR_108579 [Clonorchis sinensis]